MMQRGQGFLGYARVELSALRFDHGEQRTNHRPVSDHNVKRLLNIFTIEGCNRTSPENHIKGIADCDTATGQLQQCIAPVLPEDCEHLPLLSNVPIKCLNGLHRTIAAKQFLDQNDRWWMVALYSDVLPTERYLITEEYLNEQAYSDGEIFRKIRLYHQKGLQSDEQRWWARLTETKRKDLRQLLRDERYARAFDALLPWPGLWSTIRLGSLHRLLTMKCDDELLRYLKLIHNAWTHICSPSTDFSYPESVDKISVQLLQGLSPAMSASDARTVRTLMEEHQIFTAIPMEQIRTALLARLLEYNSMIPSIFTFFEGLKYLEPGAKILRSLLPLKQKKSIYSAFSAAYFHPPTLTVEFASGRKCTQDQGELPQDRAYGYQQLWLFALRNFTNMTDHTPRKEPGKSKPSTQEPDMHLWQSFGSLAWQLGFHLNAADELRQKDGQFLFAKQILAKAGCGSGDADSISDISAILDRLRRKPEDVQPPVFTSDAILDCERRYGRPFDEDHKADRGMMFLPQMYTDVPPGAVEVTTFYCKWTTFRAFLGIEETRTFTPQIQDPEPPFRSMSTPRVNGIEEANGRCIELEQQLARQASTIMRLEAEIVQNGVNAELAQAEAQLRSQRATADTSSSLSTAVRALQIELAEARDGAQVQASVLAAAQQNEDALHLQLDQLTSSRSELIAQHERDQNAVEHSLHERLLSLRTASTTQQESLHSALQQVAGLEHRLATSESHNAVLQEMANRLDERLEESNAALTRALEDSIAEQGAKDALLHELHESSKDAQDRLQTELNAERNAKEAAFERVRALEGETHALSSAVESKTYALEVSNMNAAERESATELQHLQERNQLAEQLRTTNSLLALEAQMRDMENNNVFTQFPGIEADFLMLRLVHLNENMQIGVWDWIMPQADAKALIFNNLVALRDWDFSIGIHQRQVLVNKEPDYVYACWASKKMLWACQRTTTTELTARPGDWPNMATLEEKGFITHERSVTASPMVPSKRKRMDGLIPPSVYQSSRGLLHRQTTTRAPRITPGSSTDRMMLLSPDRIPPGRGYDAIRSSRGAGLGQIESPATSFILSGSEHMDIAQSGPNQGSRETQIGQSISVQTVTEMDSLFDDA